MHAAWPPVNTMLTALALVTLALEVQSPGTDTQRFDERSRALVRSVCDSEPQTQPTF